MFVTFEPSHSSVIRISAPLDTRIFTKGATFSPEVPSPNSIVAEPAAILNVLASELYPHSRDYLSLFT